MGRKIFNNIGANMQLIVMIFFTLLSINLVSSASIIGDSMIASNNPDTNYWYTDWLLDKDTCSATQCKAYMKFDLSSLYDVNQINQITDAQLQLFNFFNIITAYGYGVDNQTWDPKTITWNNAPSHGSLIDSVLFGTPGATAKLNITTWLQNEFSSGNTNGSIMFNASASSKVSSSERYYGGPAITISYTLFVQPVSPTASQTFPGDVLFNITNTTAYDNCYAEMDSATNYTMPYNGNNAWGFTNSSMTEGDHNVTFWCNQTSDGVWRKTDLIDFSFDPENVTMCRNLGVAREYELLNDLNSIGDCFTTSIDGITLDGNNFNVNGSGTDDAVDLDHDDFKLKNINITNFAYGLFSANGLYDTIVDNVTISSSSQTALYFPYARSSVTINNSILSGNNRGISFFSPTYYGTNDIQIINSNISSYGAYDIDIDIDDGSVDVINSTFSIADTSEGSLVRKWYIKFQVNDSNGYLDNANISVYYEDDSFEISGLTNSNGTLIQEVTEYVESIEAITYKTPNTVNVSKTNYVTNSTIYNLTEETNVNSFVILALEDRSPIITIVDPKPQSYSINESLSLNYNIYDLNDDVDSCWYKLINVTGAVLIDNVSLASCSNSTFNVSGGTGEYNLTIYANDSSSNINQTTVNFYVSLASPAVVLDYPTNGLYFDYGENIFINFTATDPDGLSTCELWGNFDGDWSKNYTWISPLNETQNYTQLNLSDKDYTWNIWCNDTSGNSGFAFQNSTFTVDTISPSVAITDPISTTAGSQTVSVETVISDTNLDSCKYSIYNSTSSIDGLNENVSFTCSSTFSATVTKYGDYTMRVYAIDFSDNENYNESNFTTSASTGTIGGGGGGAGEDVETVPVIALQQVDGGVYSELERAIFYARINNYCSEKVTSQTFAISDFSEECSLKKSDIEVIQSKLVIEGITATVDDLILFYAKYTSQELDQTFQTIDIIETYNLFTSVLGLTNPMRINPPRLDKPFIVYSEGGNITIEQVFTINKDIRDCVILSGDGFRCEVISKTTVKMILEINNTDFFDEIFSGEMSITSDADPSNLEVKRIVLIPRVYNLMHKFMGVPAVYFIGIIGFVIIALSVFFVMRSRIQKRIKGRKSS